MFGTWTNTWRDFHLHCGNSGTNSELTGATNILTLSQSQSVLANKFYEIAPVSILFLYNSWHRNEL